MAPEDTITMDDNSHQNTLSDPLIETHDDVFPTRHQPRKEGFRWRWPIIHLSIMMLYLVLITVLVRNNASCGSPYSPQTISPADSTLEYELRYFQKYGHLTSPFSKKPGPELDAAWHQQLSGMNIRISKQWLQPFGVNSIHLADGSGVIVQLGMYHELHCLKKIKHWIYRPYYVNGNASEPDTEEEFHVEHCLEWLRVAALCRGDTTLTTFQWSKDRENILETEYPIPRRCVNSDQLLRWSEERAVDITQLGLLEKPVG